MVLKWSRSGRLCLIFLRNGSMGQIDQIHKIIGNAKTKKKTGNANKRQREALVVSWARIHVHNSKVAQKLVHIGPSRLVWLRINKGFIFQRNQRWRTTHSTFTRDAWHTRPNLDANIPQTCPCTGARIVASRAVPKRYRNGELVPGTICD